MAAQHSQDAIATHSNAECRDLAGSENDSNIESMFFTLYLE